MLFVFVGFSVNKYKKFFLFMWWSWDFLSFFYSLSLSLICWLICLLQIKFEVLYKLILFLFILFSLNAVVLVNIVCFKQKIIIALKHLIFILEKSVYFLYHYFKKNLHLIYKLDYIILVCFCCFISKNIIYNAWIKNRTTHIKKTTNRQNKLRI